MDAAGAEIPVAGAEIRVAGVDSLVAESGMAVFAVVAVETHLVRLVGIPVVGVPCRRVVAWSLGRTARESSG